MTVQLDGKRMASRAALHDHLAQQLQLPDYYGRNLDALYDLLTEQAEHTIIELLNQDVMLASLGSYGEILIETLEQAMDENPNLTFLVKNEEGR